MLGRALIGFGSDLGCGAAKIITETLKEGNGRRRHHHTKHKITSEVLEMLQITPGFCEAGANGPPIVSQHVPFRLINPWIVNRMPLESVKTNIQ